MKTSIISFFSIILLLACTSSKKKPFEYPSWETQDTTKQEKPDTSGNKVVSTDFISRQGSKLYLHGQQWRGMGFNNPCLTLVEDSKSSSGKTRVLPSDYEIEDAMNSMAQMGMNVIRLMPPGILSNTSGQEVAMEDAYIQGPGQFNETAFRRFDKVLQLANQLDIKVLIPFNDCHPYFGGIAAFVAMYGKAYINFYNDPVMIQATQQFYNYVINRTNYYTGVRYRDDKAILAWELGNELSSQGNAVIALLDGWERQMSAYIKSIDPNHLVCSGRGSSGWTDASFTTLPDIDIVDCHYSPNYVQTLPISGVLDPNMTTRVVRDVGVVCDKYQKVLIAGEGPSYATPDKLIAFMDQGFSAGLSVCMPWSFRPHSKYGGFLVHVEGLFPADVTSPGYTVYPENTGLTWMSWHWPGLPSREVQWETEFMKAYREEVYKIVHGVASPPPYPVCDPPVLISATDRTNIKFRGSAGGKNYDIDRSDDGGTTWNRVVTGYVDDVNVAANANAKMTNDNSATAPGANTSYRVRANNCDNVPSNWSDPLKFGTTYTPPN